MKFTVHVQVDHVSGPESDEETVLDAFCAAIGEQNGAKPPITFATSWDEEGKPFSTYLIKLVDDRPIA